ncbi:hypothetical protein KGM_203292 [Danaus plexippus plexippus]|uniref:Uncharacterized protein n=1 Tax=Danaus plexippus plexippus TaxID=278856 RepID=A0A212EQE6_DANPL|nr:hypothetical protein KGM_203292 [Danaus plexippus plexippus]
MQCNKTKNVALTTSFAVTEDALKALAGVIESLTVRKGRMSRVAAEVCIPLDKSLTLKVKMGLAVRCSPDEFRCEIDLTCIEGRKRCDGIPHCRDGSDEQDCACSTDQWQCDQGSCIKRSKRCDGRVDCPTDRSDERHCVGKIVDRNGKLIPQYQRCNRQYECDSGDYSDEQNCRKLRTINLVFSFAGQHVVMATSNVEMVTAYLHPKNVTERMTVRMVLMNGIAIMV